MSEPARAVATKRAAWAAGADTGLRRHCELVYHVIAGGTCNVCAGDAVLSRRVRHQVAPERMTDVLQQVLRAPGQPQPLDRATRAP